MNEEGKVVVLIRLPRAITQSCAAKKADRHFHYFLRNGYTALRNGTKVGVLMEQTCPELPYREPGIFRQSFQ